MRDEKAQAGRNATGGGRLFDSGPRPRRAAEPDWKARVGRPAATAVAVALALLLGWHVVNGKNGVSPWLEKRVEERQLDKGNTDLQTENGRLRERNRRLDSDPDAIGMVARDQLHYLKPNEVSVFLPPEPKAQTAPAAAGK
jgi:cell division protein FtsB